MPEPYYVKARDRWVAAIEAGWTERGTRRRITVSGRTERECKQKMRAKEREVLLSGVPDEASRAGVTVKAYADEWIPRQEAVLRPSPFATTRSYMTKWVIPTIGHKRLDRLSPGDVRAVALAMDAENRSTATIRRGHGELARMLNDAHADGHLVPDRAREVKLRSGGGKAIGRGVLSGDEIAALLTTIADRPDKARWIVSLFTGMRPAEVRGLTWDRIDFERGAITVDWQLKALPYKTPRDRSSGFRVPRDYEARHLHDSYHLVRPKTSSGWRVVPMMSFVSDALTDWRGHTPASPHNLVFPRPDGRGMDDRDDRQAWRDLCADAGIGPHDLYEARHTAATLLAANGASDADLIAIMGHSTIVSTRAYLHADIERAREALARVEAAVTTKQIEG